MEVCECNRHCEYGLNCDRFVGPAIEREGPIFDQASRRLSYCCPESGLTNFRIAPISDTHVGIQQLHGRRHNAKNLMSGGSLASIATKHCLRLLQCSHGQVAHGHVTTNPFFIIPFRRTNWAAVKLCPVHCCCPQGNIHENPWSIKIVNRRFLLILRE